MFIERGKGPAVVLIHGMFMDNTMFRPQLEGLAHKYRVIAYNNRTLFGQLSEHNLDDLAEDCNRVLDELEIDSCVLGGLSMGGFTAMTYALKYPERLNGLIVIAAGAAAYGKGEKERFSALFDSANIDGMIPREYAENVAGIVFGQTTHRLNRELVDYCTSRWCEMLPARAIYYQGYSWLDKPDLSEEIANIRVPTLLISGSEDMSEPIERIKPMMDVLPDAELVEIPSAGHMTNLEQPGLVNKVIEEFLERVYVN